MNETKDSMQIAYFGYGSLVNDATRNKTGRSIPGRLKGFVREWRIRSKDRSQNVCSLTAKPSIDNSIDGVLVFEHSSGLEAIDRREANYDRLDFPVVQFSSNSVLPESQAAYIYQAKSARYNWGDADHPILQSYIDAVMQGFLNQFGEQGAFRFVQETDGWGAPILNDRDKPVYPRSVTLSPTEKQIIDQALNEAGVHFLTG
ncbi:MAG: gamma-glutamylcyclotransferase [Cohaesibacteraceae bacterium]|nr:gamma-glutamylcyclotransferase [Cohaesibacteraceae bacterium]MBL4876565.1 gamma-glutamylcyclotransferase [Cohaesibacteraceae bacterium]